MGFGGDFWADLDLKAHADDAVGMREHREEGEAGDEEEIDLG